MISIQAAAPVLPRERGPPAAAVLQHPRGQAPPVALGDDDGALEGQDKKSVINAAIYLETHE